MDSNGIEKNDVVTESNLAETKCAKLSSYVINLLFSNKIDARGPKRKTPGGQTHFQSGKRVWDSDFTTQAVRSPVLETE